MDSIDNLKDAIEKSTRATELHYANKKVQKESKINEISDGVKGRALGKRIAQARNANKKFMNKYPNNQIAIDKNDPKADEWLKDSADAMDKTAKARKMYNKVVEDWKSNDPITVKVTHPFISGVDVYKGDILFYLQFTAHNIPIVIAEGSMFADGEWFSYPMLSVGVLGMRGDNTEIKANWEEFSTSVDFDKAVEAVKAKLTPLMQEALKPFRLTKADAKYLMDMGYSRDDLRQIQKAANSFKTKFDVNGEKVSRDIAMEKLGREKFLDGLARSAFHWSSSQKNNDVEVGFDSSKFFETSLSKNLLNAIKLAEDGTDKTVEVTIKDCVANWYEGAQGQYFEVGKKYSFEEFQSKIYEFDWQVWNKGNYTGGYDKLSYTANITVNGDDNTYKGRIDLGDGKDGLDNVNIAEYMKKYIGEELKANVVITNEVPSYKPEEYAKKYGTFKENAEKYIAENTRELPQGTDYSKKTAEQLAVGDIFYDSDTNGYGQTYYDFYRVTKRTKASIWVEPLKQQTYELPTINSKGDRIDYVKYTFPTDEVADAKHYIDTTKPFRLKKSYSGDVMAVQGSGYSQQYIRPWNGKPMKK
jgi:hypothetical protein